MNTNDTNRCSRSKDLVAYLYKEASEIETKSFEKHLAECTHCYEELEAFTNIRGSIALWHEEAVEAFEPTALIFDSKIKELKIKEMEKRPKRSALLAISEFFNLSPWWLRAGTALATPVICLLATLALFNAEISFNNGGFAFSAGRERVRIIEQEVPVEKIVKVELSKEEIDNLVKQRVEEEIATINAQKREVSAVEQAKFNSPKAGKRKATTKPLLNIEEQQDPMEMDQTPRLYDLIGEVGY
jgi:hypothetical protein